MKRENPKSILILAGLLLAVCSGFGFSPFPEPFLGKIPGSYFNVVSQADWFIAITNDGRIDWISDNGTVIKTKSIEGEEFQTALINNQQLIVAGVQGSIFYFEKDADFQLIESGTTQTINCLAQFKNQIIAGYDNGELQIGNPGEPFKNIRLAVKGNIVSISSNALNCYGVTNRGEIIHTNDGLNWTIFDFNKVYDGYYNACSFEKVLVTPNQIAVIGKNVDGAPVLFFSSAGNVWSERTLTYTDEQGFNAKLSEIPNDIYYDSLKDQFILLCSNGIIMTIPSCSHCNKLYKITDKNLRGISGNEHAVILVGDNNFIKIINTDTL
jgi:hypothetical protein